MSLLPVYDPKERQFPAVKSFCFHLLLSITIMKSSHRGLQLYLWKRYYDLSWKYFPAKNDSSEIIAISKLS